MAGFAKYDGVDGEAVDAQHEDWVAFRAYSWGAARASGSTGSVRRRGAAVVQDFVLVFDYEKTAPKLLESCLTGRVIPKLDVELTTTTGDGGRQTYLRYELKNVMVSSYQVGGSGEEGAGRPEVSVSNSFEKLTVTYTSFDGFGSTTGTTETTYKGGISLSPTNELEPAAGSKKSKKKRKK